MENEKRLIDAAELDRKLEALAKKYYEQGRFEAAKDYSFVQTVLLAAPTVDAVEVVHGRWVFGTANHREYMKCSVCLKSQTPTGVFTYCPNCGAKMDGGEENVH